MQDGTGCHGEQLHRLFFFIFLIMASCSPVTPPARLRQEAQIMVLQESHKVPYGLLWSLKRTDTLSHSSLSHYHTLLITVLKCLYFNIYISFMSLKIELETIFLMLNNQYNSRIIIRVALSPPQWPPCRWELQLERRHCRCISHNGTRPSQSRTNPGYYRAFLPACSCHLQGRRERAREAPIP